VTTATGLHIRWGVRRDVPHLAAFGTWAANQIETVLRRRECISIVAEGRDERPAVYAVYSLNRRSLGLLTLAVRPDLRRSGVGAALVAKLKYKVCSHRRERCTVAVPDGNLAMLLFLRAQGFKATGFDRAAGEVLMTWEPTAGEVAAFPY
jgi:ribosomal-protein-alanine N-acetyltransferase